MLLCRAEAAELGRDLRSTDASGIQQSYTADQLNSRTAGGDRRATAASVKASVENPPVGAGSIDGDGYRIKSPQAAPPAAPRQASTGV